MSGVGVGLGSRVGLGFSVGIGLEVGAGIGVAVSPGAKAPRVGVAVGPEVGVTHPANSAPTMVIAAVVFFIAIWTAHLLTVCGSRFLSVVSPFRGTTYLTTTLPNTCS